MRCVLSIQQHGVLTVRHSTLMPSCTGRGRANRAKGAAPGMRRPPPLALPHIGWNSRHRRATIGMRPRRAFCQTSCASCCSLCQSKPALHTCQRCTSDQCTAVAATQPACVVKAKVARMSDARLRCWSQASSSPVHQRTTGRSFCLNRRDGMCCGSLSKRRAGT